MRRCLAAAVGFFWLAVVGCTAISEEDGVLVLEKSNFKAAIQENPFILVEFYAPWCGHCKQFAPEYAAAAKQLKLVSPPVPLAKVDVTKESELAEEYGVRGYPTLRLFVRGRDQEYTGGRTTQNLVQWVNKKAGPPAIFLSDEVVAEAFERENRLVVVGLFKEGESRQAFEAAARQVEDVMFAYSTASSVIARYQLKAPAMRMIFPHDEKVAEFEGSMQSVEEMERFVKAYKLPLIVPFDGETAPEIFSDGRDAMFLFRNKEEANGTKAEEEFRKVASSLKRRLVLSIAGSAEPMDQRLMDYVRVEPTELPTLRLVTNLMGHMQKYRPEGELSEANIAAFVRDFDAGKLKPYLKSAPVPEKQEDLVIEVVGSTFGSIVKDPEQDVVVMFYAPWCGHCKKLEPVFRELAEKVADVKTLKIAKLDATANDVEDVDIQGFPTIKLWKATHKEEPLDFEGDRDLESFLKWLEANADHAFKKSQDTRSEL